MLDFCFTESLKKETARFITRDYLLGKKDDSFQMGRVHQKFRPKKI